jgi:exodeoxyribonuclease VII large subunit
VVATLPADLGPRSGRRGGGTVGPVSDGALFDESVGRGPASDTWTVGELSAHLGRLLVSALPDDVWIAGQIRNLKRSANGHVYFDLAEPAPNGQQPLAQLSVTLLAPEKELVNRQLKRAGGAVRMTDGVEVRLQGRIRWYGPRGVLQLRMHGIDPEFTLGRLQADRDRLLAALAADGLLERNAHLPFPLVPLRIGLVTSRGSAAHADVLSELEASGIGFEVRSVDARTQGPSCAPSVTQALSWLAADGVDLILVVRGGGARTDLAGFDSELVARAIATSPVPVLTGIGHEIDRSIADEVAHQAHKTPTAAAAAVVEQVLAFRRQVDEQAAALQAGVARATRIAESRLAERRGRAARAAGRSLLRADHRLATTGERTGRAATRSVDRADARLEATRARLGRAARARLAAAEHHLVAVEARAGVHDPALALARGWSITTTAAGQLVRRPADAPPGTELVTRLAEGTLHSTVTADPTEERSP